MTLATAATTAATAALGLRFNGGAARREEEVSQNDNSILIS